MLQVSISMFLTNTSCLFLLLLLLFFNIYIIFVDALLPFENYTHLFHCQYFTKTFSSLCAANLMISYITHLILHRSWSLGASSWKYEINPLSHLSWNVTCQFICFLKLTKWILYTYIYNTIFQLPLLENKDQPLQIL